MCTSNECRDNTCCYFIIFGIIFVVFGLIGMLCFTAGYINNKNFNEQQTIATCTVVSSYVQSDTCSYSCNCDGSSCSTCYYTCYNGVVYASIPSVTSSSPVTVVYYLDKSSQVTSYLQYRYPNGASFICYYNTNFQSSGSVQIKLGLRDYTTSFYVGIVFCSLAAVTLLVFLIFMAYGYLPIFFECIGDCFVSCCFTIKTRLNENKRNRQLKKKQREDIKKQQEIEKLERGQFETSQVSLSNEYVIPPQQQIVATAPPLDESQKIQPSAPPLRQSEYDRMKN